MWPNGQQPRGYVPAVDDFSREELAARRRRRAQFLQDLAEARSLRERVAPRRTRRMRAHTAHRLATYRA